MRPTSDPARHATLIGREREIDLLRASLDGACEGNGRLLLIGGEAGIGKTMLVRDLTRHARQCGALVLTGACYDLTTTPPYGPWVEAIRDYVPQGVQPSVPAWFGKPDEISRMGGQAALFEESRRFFSSIAVQQPLLLVLEDLHWADPATVEALRFLSRAMTEAPALIAVSYRDDEPRRGNPFVESIPSLVREADATRVELRRWPEAATRELIAGQYGLPEADEARLAAYVQQRCGGNPFFTVELLHTLESDGTLRPDERGWELGDLEHTPLPPIVRQVIEQRLSRLSGATRDLAQVAAVMGQRVPFDAWLQVSGVDEDRLATAVDEIVAAQLADELAGRDGIQFRHALVRDTLYGSLNGLRLQRLHAQVAETLLRQPAPDPDLVADHLDRAGDARRVDWLVRAGERAVRTFAWHSAVERFEAALRLLGDTPERRDESGWLLLRLGLLLRFSDQARGLRNIEAARDAGERTGDRALTAFARFYAGLVRHYGDFSGVSEIEAGIRAIDALSDDDLAPVTSRIAEVGPGYLPGVSGLGDQRGTLASALYQIGRLHDASEVGKRFLAEVRARPIDERQAAIAGRDASGALAVAYAMTGRAAEAREMAALAERGYRGIGNQWVLRLRAQEALNFIVLPYFTERIDERQRLEQIIVDSWRQAIQVVPDRDDAIVRADFGLAFVDGRWREAYQAASIGSEPRWEAVSRYMPLRWAAELDLHLGNVERFWERLQTMLADGHSSAPGTGLLDTGLRLQQLAARACLDRDEANEARAWLEANDRWFAWSGSHLLRAEGQIEWSRYHRHMGDLQPARLHAERARSIASDPRQPLALIAARRALGEIETLDGHLRDADDHLAGARELAERCQAPFEIALTQLARAELAVREGNARLATMCLSSVQETLKALEARPALQRASRIEVAIGAIGTALPNGLTRREVEILCLLAEGLSNRAIADRLYLSVRTVERHATNIYGKIDTASRTEAANYVRRHGLTTPGLSG